MYENKIVLKDTRLIFRTNFSGNPSRDSFEDKRRKANIVVPDDLADSLREMGCNVRKTKGANPVNFVLALVNYGIDRYGRIRRVNVFRVRDGKAKALTEDTVGELDMIRTGRVDVVLNPWLNHQGSTSLFVETMYVEELPVEEKPVEDPFYGDYQHVEDPEFSFTDMSDDPDFDDETELPF